MSVVVIASRAPVVPGIRTLLDTTRLGKSHSQSQNVGEVQHHLAPRPRARAKPLERPLPRVSDLPLDDDEPRAEGRRDWRVDGFDDFVAGFAETGGFSTKEVSVVLREMVRHQE